MRVDRRATTAGGQQSSSAAAASESAAAVARGADECSVFTRAPLTQLPTAY